MSDSIHSVQQRNSTTELSLPNSFRIFTTIVCLLSMVCVANAQQTRNTANHFNKKQPSASQAERPYFNDKKIPNTRDLLEIQKLLQKNKDKARAATVCIKIGQGSGSGVIVSEDGLILTAAHVSSGINKDLIIVMEDGTEHKAISLGLDSETDAAMVQIADKGTFPYVEIEPAKEPENASTKLGDWVFSLGHSGGFDKERGSGLRLGRLVRIAERTIQTDCTLIGGDSGGPLFDMNGMLIGIHSRVGLVTEQNMHVPMHVFHTHWEAMKRSDFIGEGPFAKKPIKGQAFIGIEVEKAEKGLLVIDIDKRSAAEKNGIKKGDVIIKINDKDINSRDDIVRLMEEKTEGDILKLTILRNSKKQVISLKLGSR